MKLTYTLLLLSALCSAQTFTAKPTEPEKKEMQVHFTYVGDANFLPTECFWHIYKEGQPKDKPLTVEGCKSIDFSLPMGEHLIELVVNGHQPEYQHLSLDQRHITHKITVGSCVKVD